MIKANKRFKQFLNELSKEEKVNINGVNKEIFYQLFKIREAQSEYKDKAHRGVDYALADIFQDLVAHYLRTQLNKHYEVLIEDKIKKCRPDIVIKKNGKYHAAIEIKTNIGWDRQLSKKENYTKRLKTISRVFNIPIKRCIYVFENVGNVSKEFEKLFWNNSKPLPSSKKIHRFIFPLFHKRPYVRNDESGKKLTNKKIFELADRITIRKFSEIIKRIK